MLGVAIMLAVTGWGPSLLAAGGAVAGRTAPRANITILNPSAMKARGPISGVTLRKFPYPYQAMLAVSPDADHMTLRKFNLIHEFLNTDSETPWGRGLGLDIADSMFMYNGSNINVPIDWPDVPLSDELTWFHGVSSTPYGAAILNRYVHDGWIDTLHSYGDFSRVDHNQTEFTPDLAKQAVLALEADGDHIVVWTDHGNMSNVDNFGNYGNGSFFAYQQGANPGSPYYHTDITIPYGIEFVWADVHSSRFGESNTLYPIDLPDGRKVWGFQRYTNDGQSATGSLNWVWTINDLYLELSTANLNSLVADHQYSVITQHFYKDDNTKYPLPESAVKAFRLLAGYYRDGKILVARTSRLLIYNEAQDFVQYVVRKQGDETLIQITKIADPVLGVRTPTLDDVRGITFYVRNPSKARLYIGSTPVPADLVQRNPSDGIEPSIEIRWWPTDTTNYAISDPSIP